MFSRDHFNSSIKEFQAKYSAKWDLLIHENQFLKYSQLYLKMTSVYNNELAIDSYIVYSDSYGQPVLYFLPMIQTEDSTKFASIEDLKLFLSADIGSISIAENPINGLLMYIIHPCFTGKFMNEILNSVEKSVIQCSYIESWLSFCPFIPIKRSLNL